MSLNFRNRYYTILMPNVTAFQSFRRHYFSVTGQKPPVIIREAGTGLESAIH